MAKRQPRVKQSSIIIVAIIVSIILYVAGVMTGLNANKLVEKQVKGEITDIKTLLDDSALDLKSIQLQQYYIDNFPQEDRCQLLDIYAGHLYDQINSFWQVLPSRLESYDQQTQQSPEYTALKREYIRLSLRFWLTTVNAREQCDNQDLIGILYFYTPECENCVAQGEAFDHFQLLLKRQKNIIVFPIDATFEDDTVYMLKQFYNITSYPTVIINGKAVQGRVVSAKELQEAYT